jgi:hypothetical protein
VKAGAGGCASSTARFRSSADFARTTSGDVRAAVPGQRVIAPQLNKRRYPDGYRIEIIGRSGK